MATIKFILKSEKSPASIYVRLIDGRSIDVMSKTNFFINPVDWSKAKQQPKNLNNLDNKHLNAELTSLRSSLLKYYNRHNGNTEINTQWLKGFINPSSIVKTAVPETLINYIDYYIECRSHELKALSIRRFNVVKHKLQRFEAARGSKILISEINNSFKKEFVEYYQLEKYAASTMQRDLVFIKTFCKHARYSGLDTHPQLDGLRLDRVKADKVYLSFEELKQISNVDVDKFTDSLNNAKDWLIISCYTGQRVSDFMRFSSNMIRVENGKHLIEFTQQKTGKVMTVPLHPEVMTILEKRNGEFPYAISDQKYNDYIKTVCEIAEITQMIKGSRNKETAPKSKVFRKESGIYRKCDLISSHVGRRSFATNFYGKIPTSLLIAATGHSTETMFLSYIGKSDSDKAKQLAEYF